jgi:hypothetical protein
MFNLYSEPEQIAQKQAARLVSAGCSLGIAFDPEDGSDVPRKRRTLSEVQDVAAQKAVLFIATLREHLQSSGRFTSSVLASGSRRA